MARRRTSNASCGSLQSIQSTDSSYEESKIYSSVLGAFQFLNYTRDSMTDALAKDDLTMVDALCALQVDTFLQNLDTATGYLVTNQAHLARDWVESTTHRVLHQRAEGER